MSFPAKISQKTVDLVKANYPDHILVTAARNVPGKKWAAFCCLQKDGVTDTVLMSTKYQFVTELEAKAYMNLVVDWCVEFVKKESKPDANA